MYITSYLSYIIQFHEKVKWENLLLTRHRPAISHWGDSIESVWQFRQGVVSNLVWPLEIAKIKVENKVNWAVFIVVKKIEKKF